MTLSATRAACTIVTPDSLHSARTLARSFLKHHPDHHFFVLLVADLDPSLYPKFADEPFITLFPPHIGLQNLPSQAMKYDLHELAASVKPGFLKHLLLTHSLTHLVYLDPDVCVYAPLTPVFDALTTHDAILTPHLTSPADETRVSLEHDCLSKGTYNLGFFATRNTPNAFAILSWWERRCLDLAFSEGQTGLFLDQKWMNLAPGLFDRIHILRHPGCNMAYWNLQERTLTQYSGRTIVQGPVLHGTATEAPLIFFHFSGVDPRDPASLSRNTDLFTLARRPDLARLFADYKARVLANANPGLEDLSYGFDRFSDGAAVTHISRRLYAELHQRLPVAGTDPFDAHGPWARYARTRRFVTGTVPSSSSESQALSVTDRDVQWVHRLLRLALRLLGPFRYGSLMNYLAHITVLRNQAVFLNRDLPDRMQAGPGAPNRTK